MNRHCAEEQIQQVGAEPAPALESMRPTGDLLTGVSD